MGNFAKVNEVYSKYFDGESKPARSCKFYNSPEIILILGVAVYQLPKLCLVEFECVAIVPK